MTTEKNITAPKVCPHCCRPELSFPAKYESMSPSAKEKIYNDIENSRIRTIVIVDKNQGVYMSQPEDLCGICAKDVAKTCNNLRIVKEL